MALHIQNSPSTKDVADMERLVRAKEIFYFEAGSGLHIIWAPLGDDWTVGESDRQTVLRATRANDVERIKNEGILMALDEHVSDEIFALLRTAVYYKYHTTIRVKDGALMDGLYFGRNHFSIAIKECYACIGA